MSARYLGYSLFVALPGLLLTGWVLHVFPEGDRIVTMGPDLVVIERTDVFGSLERPAVSFQHGLHVEALEEEGCTACHDQDDEGMLIPLFGRDIEAPGELTDFFHERCIGCHEDKSAAGLDFGPLMCGSCHVAGTSYAAERQPMGLDLGLHQRHVEASDDKCETCHHVYDEEADALVYEEGQESSCRDCHGESTVGDTLGMREASHLGCVGCHLQREEQGEEAGPTDCAGCHEDGALDPLVVVPDVERLDRDQPDQTTIAMEHARFLDVEFDHQRHETVTSQCRVCHHQKLDRCTSCHTHLGDEAGDGVKAVEAFHESSSTHSCIGCHNRIKRGDTNCFGCHGDGDLAHGRTEGSCHVCHDPQLLITSMILPMEPQAMPVTAPPGDEIVEPVDASPAPPLAPPDDLESEVEIGSLADEYRPVTFQHGEHIEKLTEAGGQLELSAPFHADSAITCIACHHTATVDEDDELCTACHGDPVGPGDPGALLGAAEAYHRQCVGCHVRMDARTEEGDRPITCVDCHEEAPAAAAEERE